MTLVAIMGFKLCATTLFVLSLLIAFLSRSGTEGADVNYLFHNCSNTNFTANSTYQSKLNNLLASLTSNAARPTGFYNTTASSPNSVETVYGLFLCRGDISSDDCRDCVSGATKDVVERCPRGKEAVAWYDYCMLRYANQDFFSRMDTEPGGTYMWNPLNKSDPTRFDLLVKTTMNDLSSGVTNVGSGAMKFGTKEANFTALPPLYTLAQCTPDLSGSDCNRCLQRAIEILRDLWGKQGGRILYPSCNVRFEVYQFYKVNTSAPKPSTPALVPPPPGSVTKLKGSGGGKNTTKIVIITISSIAVVAALLGFWYYSSFGRKKRNEEEEIMLGNWEDLPSVHFMDGSIQARDQDNSTREMDYFNLSTMQAATNNFSDANKLGEGGFGPVYKGKLIDGKEIAVKRLSMKSKQGLEEFRNEVSLIVKLQHKHLVRLLGCCLEGGEKLLVYEYMANTSLDAFLFDPKKSVLLDWAKRTNILNGIARGLLYLHEDSRLKIIHRDMKASNVLLDDEMNPKISDFGTTRIFDVNQIEANTNIVVGTYGYMAPEYALEGQFSIKSDVYSFGVLMLEIISGKKNMGFYHPDRAESLLPHAWRVWNEDKGIELIDQTLVDTCPESEALRLIHIALLCVQEDPNDRPTMLTVVLMLRSSSINLPPFSLRRSILSDQSSTTGPMIGFSISNQSSTSAST